MVRRPQGGVTSSPGSRGEDSGDSERGLTVGRFDQVNLGGEGHWATRPEAQGWTEGHASAGRWASSFVAGEGPAGRG